MSDYVKLVTAVHQGNSAAFSELVVWFRDMVCYGEPERQEIIRGRCLHRLLSQPLTVVEPWSGTPAAYVPLPETMATVQAILNGELDEVSEEELMMIGQWSPGWTKCYSQNDF